MTFSLTDYMRAMGIEIWQRKPRASQCNTVTPSNWETLQATVATCTACELACTRTQTVFGIGKQNAKLLLIGDAPDLAAEQQGEPFVGPAGDLLNAMLTAIGESRQTVYLTNTIKCRPPRDRAPQANEIAHCFSFLQQQIQWVQPTLILTLGPLAAQTLLATTATLAALRENLHHYTTGKLRIPVITTYHPAQLLIEPANKRGAWHDLQKAQKILAQG